jgi:hypothetical protein
MQLAGGHFEAFPFWKDVRMAEPRAVDLDELLDCLIVGADRPA